MRKGKSKFTESCAVVNPLDGDIISMEPCVDPEGRGYNSPRSPTDLRYTRSHQELAGRNDPPLASGLSLKEPLETRDDWNWD